YLGFERPNVLPDRVHSVLALADVDVLYGGEDPHRKAGGVAAMAERGNILRQATAAVANAGAEVRRADTRGERSDMGTGMDVDDQVLAETGYLIDEGDLRCKESVRDVLDHLGAAQVGEDDRCAQAFVKLGNSLSILPVLRSDDDALRVEEVIDAKALTQELRV